MLIFKLLVIWAIWFRSSHSVTPGVLLALAHLQNQKARNIANALNWRAKAQYSVALAKARASLAKVGDRRIIRNSREFNIDDVLDNGPETNPLLNNDNFEGVSQMKLSSDENNEFHADQWIGIPGYQIENEGAEAVTDKDIEVYDTPDLPHQISNVPNCDMPSYQCNGFETDFYPGTEGPPSNIMENQNFVDSQLSESEPTKEKSAEADPHIHKHGHFHKHIFHHNKYLEPPTRIEHIHSPHFFGQSSSESMFPPQSSRPSEVNVHISQNQHIGGVSSNSHVTPLSDTHFHGEPVQILQSSGGSQYSPSEGNSEEGGQIYRSGEDMTERSWDDEEQDQMLGTFPLPMLTPNEPEYPNVRNPDQFDPNEPQNFQAIVRFIEAEQRSISRMIHSLDRNRLHYNGPAVLPNIENYQDHPDDYLPNDDENYEHYKVRESAENNRTKLGRVVVSKEHDGQLGAAHNFGADEENFGPIRTGNDFPVPLPEFSQLDATSQQNMFTKYLEIEQANLQRAVQELQDEHQRNLDNLLHFLHGNDHIENSYVGNYENLASNNDDINQHATSVNHFQDSFDDNNMLGYPEQIFRDSDTETRKSEENENTEMLTDFIQNTPGIGAKIGYTSAKNPILGHIIQVPERRFSEEYYHRRPRSPKNDEIDLDQLLKKETETIHFLKRFAKHDADLMMIGYIEESLLSDLQNKLNKSRAKRQLETGSKDLPLTRLLTDPNARINMPKTLENLGDIARTAFEHEQQPMFHVKNMVGSAKDAVVAAMKIPNQNFVFPSRYDIVDNQSDGLVGDINPSLYSNKKFSEETSDSDRNDADPVMDTFQKVGTVIRESVSSGQQALGHVGDFANHAKSAIFSTRFALPKIIQKEVPGFVGEPKKQTIIITPRIFDTSNENKVAQSIGGTKYIKLGSILDGLGVSNRNPNLTFKKITLEPRNAFSNEQQNIPSVQQPFSQYFRNVRVENINNVEKDADFMRDTVNNLEIAKFSVGAKNLEDFILKMKNQLQSFMNKNTIQNNLGIGTPQERRKEDHIKKPSRKWYFKTAQSKPNPKKPSTTKVNKNDDETVGASFIPTELTHPYLNQPTNNQLQGFMHVNNKWPKISKPNEDIGPLLGAINPIMFERIFNETLRSSGKTGTPHEIFSDYRSKNKTDEPAVNNEDKVSTSFSVKGQILKPFMGQATSKNKKDFFKKYQPSKDKTNSASLEYEENNYDYETTWY